MSTCGDVSCLAAIATAATAMITAILMSFDIDLSCFVMMWSDDPLGGVPEVRLNERDSRAVVRSSARLVQSGRNVSDEFRAASERDHTCGAIFSHSGRSDYFHET